MQVICIGNSYVSYGAGNFALVIHTFPEGAGNLPCIFIYISEVQVI